jgi:hypothetical protein
MCPLVRTDATRFRIAAALTPNDGPEPQASIAMPPKYRMYRAATLGWRRIPPRIMHTGTQKPMAALVTTP